MVAEWLQKNTVNDIWSLVYDHDCNIVVVLSDPPISLDKPSFFYEKGKTKVYGCFTPELIAQQRYLNIRTAMYKIRKKVGRDDVFQVDQFLNFFDILIEFIFDSCMLLLLGRSPFFLLSPSFAELTALLFPTPVMCNLPCPCLALNLA